VCTFTVGLAAILGPVALRNQLIGNTFAVTTAQLGPNFYIGNNPRATGVYAPLLPGRQTAHFEASDAALLAEQDLGRKLTRGEISDYWLGRSLDFIRTEPGRWIALLGSKSLLTINAFELPDAEDIYTYADWSALLRALLPVLHFGMLVPFAAAGMVLAWRDRRDVWILYLLVAAFAGSVAVFYVFARYRFPLVPLLLPFAGLAIVRGFELASERDYRKLIAPGIVLLAAGFVSNLALIDEARYRGTAYTNLGVVMIENGRLDEAEGYLQGAAEIDAENPDLQFHMGLLRFQQRRWSEAETHLRRMLELADSDFRGHELLARVLRRLGRHEEALNHRRQAIQLDPARGVRGPVGRDQRGRG
jgi:tetratricopeptide (TPR) repeat protein